MAKKTLATELLAAHTNALEKTMAAVETQVASVKNVLKLLTELSAQAEAGDEDASDEEAKPAPKKRGRPAKAKKPVEEDEDEDFSDDEDEEQEDDAGDDEDGDDSDDEDESDDEEDEAPAKIKKNAVVKALQTYAAENDRAGALKILKKVGGVASVHELSPKKYGAVIAALK